MYAKPIKKIKLPKCKKCKEEFAKITPLQNKCFTCTVAESKLLVAKKLDKEWKVRKKAGKEKLKTITDYRAEARKIFQRWIRIRDLGKTCISCDVLLTDIRDYDAGHYYPANHCNLIFNPNNTNGQCVACNHHKSGNLIEYRKGILARYGGEVLRELDDIADDKTTRTLSKEYYIQITEKYKKLCKDLER